MIIKIDSTLPSDARRIKLINISEAMLTKIEFGKVLKALHEFVYNPPKYAIGLFKKIEAADVWHYLRMHYSADLIDATLSSRDVGYNISFKIKRVDVEPALKAFEHKDLKQLTINESGGISVSRQKGVNK